MKTFPHEDRRSFEEYEELYKAVDSLTDKLNTCYSQIPEGL